MVEPGFKQSVTSEPAFDHVVFSGNRTTKQVVSVAFLPNSFTWTKLEKYKWYR